PCRDATLEVQKAIDPEPAHGKSEIRSTKAKTNAQLESRMLKTEGPEVSAFLLWSLEFVSDFVLRISRFILVGRAELALDVARNHVHGEQVADTAELGVFLERTEVGERHARAQFVQALFGDAAVLHVFRVALKDRFGEQFAARDLVAEFPLEPEDDVQEIDRLRTQVALQRGGGLDVVLVHVERFDQCCRHLEIDFFLTRHGLSLLITETTLTSPIASGQARPTLSVLPLVLSVGGYQAVTETFLDLVAVRAFSSFKRLWRSTRNGPEAQAAIHGQHLSGHVSAVRT